MAEPEISVAELSEIDKLMSWRMEVLRCVFAIPAGADVTAFERANRDYYARAIPAGRMSPCSPPLMAKRRDAGASASTTKCPRRTTRLADAPT